MREKTEKSLWAVLTGVALFTVILGFRNFGQYSVNPVGNWFGIQNFWKYLWLGLGGLAMTAYTKLIQVYYEKYSE